MRIFIAHPSALLTDHRPHGDGLIAHGYLRGLAERGHELHVAAQAVDLQTPFSSNVHIHGLGKATRRGPAERLRYMRRLRSLFGGLSAVAPFDLVHQLNPVDVGLTLSLFDSSVPVILGPYWPDFWSEHWAGRPSRTEARIKRLIRRAQQQRACTVLLSTPAAASKLEVATPGPVRVADLWPGIDTEHWAPGTDSGEGILFLASLASYKGVDVLLDGFEMLIRRMPSARLRIAGSGPEELWIRRRIQSTAELRGVEMLGPVERERVPVLMRGCSVYCLPSYGEPFGMSALEAMACGKPVVGTDAGGLRHLIDGAGGRKVAPGDAGGLARSLQEILSQPELARSMGLHNRRLVEERYAWPLVIDRLEDVYRRALAGGGPGAPADP